MTGLAMIAIPNWTTPKEALTPSLRALKIALHARVVFEQYPQTRLACERMAWHFTDRTPMPVTDDIYESAPLLHLCLKYAFEHSDAVLDEPAPTQRQYLTAFFSGLMLYANEITNIVVAAPDGQSWDPLGEEPLTKWLAKNPGASITIRDVHEAGAPLEPPQVRAALLNLLMGPHEIARLNVDMFQVYYPNR
jgi:hypothetical protein